MIFNKSTTSSCSCDTLSFVILFKITLFVLYLLYSPCSPSLPLTCLHGFPLSGAQVLFLSQKETLQLLPSRSLRRRLCLMLVLPVCSLPLPCLSPPALPVPLFLCQIQPVLRLTTFRNPSKLP